MKTHDKKMAKIVKITNEYKKQMKLVEYREARTGDLGQRNDKGCEILAKKYFAKIAEVLKTKDKCPVCKTEFVDNDGQIR